MESFWATKQEQSEHEHTNTVRVYDAQEVEGDRQKQEQYITALKAHIRQLESGAAQDEMIAALQAKVAELSDIDDKYHAIQRQLAAARKVWTREIPTDVGMYWWRGLVDGNEEIDIMTVTMRQGKLWASGKYVYDFVQQLHDEWAGPISLPVADAQAALDAKQREIDGLKEQLSVIDRSARLRTEAEAPMSDDLRGRCFAIYVSIEDGEASACYSEDGDDLLEDYECQWSSRPIARPEEKR